MKRAVAILLAAVLFCGIAPMMASAKGNDITEAFTDPAFRAVVQELVGKDVILDTDVAGIEELYIWYLGIESLAGLEFFTGLTILECYGNELTQLPDLPAGLIYLNCGFNQLTALPKLPAGLEVLWCNYNRLTGLDVTGLPLRELVCDHNYMGGSKPAVKGFTGTWDNLFFCFEPQLGTPDGKVPLLLPFNGNTIYISPWLNELIGNGFTSLIYNDVFYFLFNAYAARACGNFGVLSRFNARKHLEHNRGFDEELYDGDERIYIDNQNGEPIASMQYGLHDMRYNGCEMIAVYNALLALEQPKDLSRIVYDFERRGAVWLEAEFGTKISQHVAYLRKEGLRVKEYRDAKAADKARRDGDVFILTYSWRTTGSRGWNIGIHTIMVRQVDGRLEAFNNGGGWREEYDSFEEFLRLNGAYLGCCRVSA